MLHHTSPDAAANTDSTPPPLADIDTSLEEAAASHGVTVLRVRDVVIPAPSYMRQQQRHPGPLSYVFIGQLPRFMNPEVLTALIEQASGCTDTILWCSVRAAATDRHSAHAIVGVRPHAVGALIACSRRMYVTRRALYYIGLSEDTAAFQRFISRTVTRHAVQVAAESLAKAGLSFELSRRQSSVGGPPPNTSGDATMTPYDVVEYPHPIDSAVAAPAPAQQRTQPSLYGSSMHVQPTGIWSVPTGGVGYPLFIPSVVAGPTTPFYIAPPYTGYHPLPPPPMAPPCPLVSYPYLFAPSPSPHYPHGAV